MLGLGSDIMFAMMIWERKKEKKKATVMEAYHYRAGAAGTVVLVGELSILWIVCCVILTASCLYLVSFILTFIA